MLEEDNLAKEYLKKVNNKVLDKQTEVFEMLRDIGDIYDSWEESKMELNEKIMQKMIDEGVSKRDVRRF